MKTTVSQNEFATLTETPKSTVSNLVKSGVLVRDREGRLPTVKNMERLLTWRNSRQSDGGSVAGKVMGQTAVLRAHLLTVRIEQAKHDLAVAQGKYHEREACCRSLSAICAEVSVALHGLASRVAAKFPETPSNVIAGIDAEVDETIERFKAGLGQQEEVRA